MIECKFEDSSFIGGWYIDKSVCDGVVDFFYEDNYFPVVPGSTSKGTNTSKKDSFDKSISVPTRDNRIGDYLLSLHDVVDLYKEKYIFSNKTSQWAIRDPINIQLYDPGGGYKNYHTERDGGLSTINRHLVFMTYLNDVTDAGETEFYYQKLKVKPQKGLTLIWPVDWTHTHRGVPSPSQHKMIITGWFDFGNT